MKVLVTGGAGFIGSHLAHYHLNQGDTVLAIDDLSTGNLRNVAALQHYSRFEFQKACVVDWARLDKAVARADRVYHMAAVVGMFRVLKQPVEVTRVNVVGTERVLHAAARARRKPQVVIPSSSSVYGTGCRTELREDVELAMTPGAPLLNYALSKLSNEVQGRAYFDKYRVPVVMARLFNTVGRRQCGLYGFVVPRFVQQALAGTPISVFGDGNQTRSFCDVRDTVAMLDALAATPAAYGKVVNVGNAQEIRICDLAKLVIQRAQSSSVMAFIPYEQAYGQHFEHIPQRRPVLDRLRELTGYRHRWTLEQTLDDLILAYRTPARRRGHTIRQAHAEAR
ncbi:NAD-dependent epimerase/dehydratase family protein [Tahibacter amnicola]|uniref:GDP-mannose 4,6-dehydratase n=1 Tax=Tahibacter amnicola TaxID=2976241 RepID=A0ABY6B9W0_9GAMM|nr:NAD-dependent epimerase/dehydratase family protein [Tahibacter amnicola]UXI66645.1 GDP-mannose 4,6-dehydratase [Tahibacter amnicola]